VENYEAGHMMYVHPESMKKYREDLVRFIQETDRID
jgi:carboxypeptidase C (cathepsin A)